MENALVDLAANRGIVGKNMLVLAGCELYVDVFGLIGHKASQLRIVTEQSFSLPPIGVTLLQRFIKWRFLGILSYLQLEAFGADING
jgi:hypothetical protein